MLYIVDYENVNHSGLCGIDKLLSDDEVELFYSDKADNLPIDILEEILKSKANLKCIKVAKTAPNYLDFHIATKVGSLINTGIKTICIVSCDKGYISVQDYCKEQGIEVKLVSKIDDDFENKVNHSERDINKKPLSKSKTVILSIPENKGIPLNKRSRGLSQEWKDNLKISLEGVKKKNGLTNETVYNGFIKYKTL